MVPSEGVSRVAKRLACGVGIVGGTLVAIGQLSTVVPVLVVVGVLASLPMLLIIALVGVAVYSPYPGRRKTAERIFSQLLSALTGASR